MSFFVAGLGEIYVNFAGLELIGNILENGFTTWDFILDRQQVMFVLDESSGGTTFNVSPGPSFKLPASSGWAKLEEDYEPSAKELFDIVHDAYETNEKKQIVGMGENDTPVTFAGYGEPLLRLDTAAEATGLIREYRHGVKFRMETSGLLLQCDLTRSIQKILDARISEVSVFLPAADPVSYKKEMGGKLGDGYDFQGLCSFIASLAEAGVTVDCWAINKPGVDIPSLRQLALSLGAVDLLGLSYHP